MHAIFWLIDTVLSIYIMLVFAQVVLSWLVAFNVVNTRNRFVYLVGDFLYRMIEPALRPIRRMLPRFGGVDVSPMVLLVALYFVRLLLIQDIAPRLL
jgi:YggT family protein